ncbi:MetQ/NlpA family ABC transporter substrate-binding protein [Oscillospiraceae bacterium MB08-C2-2]|nr:MetQ/NlpA family ABC transporter substrate-binding protein [Oscillospiraceae bacterium MB08-C2-2]
MKFKLKNTLAVALSLVLVLVLAACGGSGASSSSQAAPASSGEAAPAESSAPVKLETLTVGASPAPHAEILEQAREDLAALGYDLRIQEFTDYVLPNMALDSGDLDANFFQHEPYLNVFNEENKTDIASAASIHVEPLGFYLGKAGEDAKAIDISSPEKLLEAVADGAKIAIPNDPSNGARGLLLLEHLGIIKLTPEIGLKATVKDIVENPKNVVVTELEAAQIPRAIQDVDFAVINGNYAIDAGVTDRLITTEASDSQGAQAYANIIAVRSADVQSDKTKALVQALQSEKVKAFIEAQYAPLAYPAF